MSLANKVILIGAGGHAKVVLDCLGGKAEGFTDASVAEFGGLKKFADITAEYDGIISFGTGLQRRQEVFLKYKAQDINFIKAIHKSSIIAKDVVIGAGSMIGPGVIINPGAVIGENVIINSGAIIEHDAVIGDGSHIAPGAIVLGGAKIGKTAMIGAGAVILPGAEVADNTLVKALSRY